MLNEDDYPHRYLKATKIWIKDGRVYFEVIEEPEEDHYDGEYDKRIKENNVLRKESENVYSIKKKYMTLFMIDTMHYAG